MSDLSQGRLLASRGSDRCGRKCEAGQAALSRSIALRGMWCVRARLPRAGPSSCLCHKRRGKPIAQQSDSAESKESVGVHAPKIAALPPKSPKAPQDSLVHLTGYKPRPNTVSLSETFWIVIESDSTTPEQQQVHQIQMWRVTVLRNVPAAPTNLIPRKT